MGQIQYHTAADRWNTLRLETGSNVLVSPGAEEVYRSVDTSANESANGWKARVLHVEAAGASADVLLVREGVFARINGQPVRSGLSILPDRSIVSVGSEHFFYTEQVPAEVQAYEPEAGSEPVFCPRCNDPIEGKAVCCPGCHHWFHESTERSCYTYSEHCPICKNTTTLGKSAWDPREL